jgi:hypothetical protein
MKARTADMRAPVTSASIAKDELAANQRNVSSANSHMKPVGTFNRDRFDLIIVVTQIASVQWSKK